MDGSLRLAQARHGRASSMPQADRETVLFLIGRHLDLSAAMQSRDVFDPQTIREVAHQVETVERLKALTLVTYADISAVNPTAMTPWRAEQLWQLYLMVYNELTRELESDRIAAVPFGPPERVGLSGRLSRRATCAPTPTPRSTSTWRCDDKSRAKRRGGGRRARWIRPGS